MRFISRFVVAIALALTLTAAAHADTFTYDVQTSYNDPSGHAAPLELAVTVDDNTFFSESFAPDQIDVETALPKGCTVSGFTITQIIGGEDLLTETICGVDHNQLLNEVNPDFFRNGIAPGSTTLTITDNPPSAVPEPSPFLLFGTGIFGMAGAIRRRYLNI